MNTNKLIGILLENLDEKTIKSLAGKLFDDELLGNLLCNAFEMGGINYWAQFVRSNKDEVGATYHWEAPLKKGGYLIICTDPDDDGEFNKKLKITRTSINRGLVSWLKSKSYNHHVADALTENDDVITGDVFYQFISMNECIYG